MKLKYYFSVLSLFAILFFSSCKKSNDIGKRIPKSASIVLHTNGESFSSKLSWADLKSSPLFNSMYNDSGVNANMKVALDNPENTGIDISSDLIFFIQQDSSGGYAALQGKIKDGDKFKSFFTNVIKGNITTGGKNESSLANDRMITMWDKDRFVIVFDAPQIKEAAKMNPMERLDSVPTVQPLPVYDRNLPATAGAIFNLEEDNSLGKDEKFSNLLKTSGDIHFWINGAALSGTAGSMPSFSMMNMSKLYEGSIFAGAANFLDGKIEVDVKNYGGKEMTNIFDKYEGGAISKEMVNRVPSKDLAVFFALNFKPQGLRELIKLSGMEGFANMGATSLGFTLDDFVNANKGDLLITIQDMKIDSVGKPVMNYLFSASINDKAAFNKLVEGAKKAGLGKPKDSLPAGIFYNLNDKYFSIGNQQSTVNTFLTTESNHSFSFIDKISGSPMGLYINFQKMMGSIPVANADSLQMESHKASMQMWDYMTAKGGEFKDGGLTQHVEINLVDKKTNSLKQLNNYFGIMSTFHEKRKAAGGNRSWNDTSLIKIDSTFAKH